VNHNEQKFVQLQRAVPDVSRETFERLLKYEAMFFKWSKAINLAAPSTLQEFWLRHVVDSAQIASLQKLSGKWVDIGSGGGLPGIILAVFLTEAGAEPIHLVESNGKKAAFLRSALTETGAKGIVINQRVESALAKVGKVDIVTARALSSLSALFAMAEAWLSQGATGLFHKGREFQREIEEARGGWYFDLIEHASVVESDSVILEISNLKRRN
jgi:16S rRNA (guanine527-N7)-methyltransferase